MLPTLSREYFLKKNPLAKEYINLPEKVLQFGTGALLRGLCDYYIHNANKNGVFGGRIIIVKTTENSGLVKIETQDNLYTLCLRGVNNGNVYSENIICSPISRILLAKTDWRQVLECAQNPHLKIIVSNTTENGLVLISESINQQVPSSFPAKLTAFLYKRFRFFDGDPNAGMIIIPTELVSRNGTLLESYVIELAHLNKLEFEFIEWLEKHCRFCNSLVDRIVPGMPNANDKALIEKEAGYEDDLMIVAEPYNLWAIEGDEFVMKALDFAKFNPGIFVSTNISKYAELKLRILNGGHTIACYLSILNDISTVKQTMDHDLIGGFVRKVMLDEISIAISSNTISLEEARGYAYSVFDRFNNPYIQHKWQNIATNSVSKMRLRIVPVILSYYTKTGNIPQLIAAGFAAFLLFIRNSRNQNFNFVYDLHTNKIAQYLNSGSVYKQQVTKVLKDKDIWETDLNLLHGLATLITDYYTQIENIGVSGTLEKIQQGVKV